MNEQVVAKAKLATLLFDTVFHSGPFPPILFAEMTVDMLNEPSLTYKAKETALEAWHKLPSDVPMFNVWTPEAKEMLESIPPALELATIEALLAHGYEPRKYIDDHKLLTYTMYEILYWRRHVSGSVFLGEDLSDFSLRRLAGPVLRVTDHRRAETQCPNVFALTWNDVFDLRKSPLLKHFRTKFLELYSTGQAADLLKHYQEGLERLSDEVRPSTMRSTLWATLSNLPIPVVNPFHVGHSIHDVWHNWHLTQEYGWLFFLRDANKRSQPEERD